MKLKSIIAILMAVMLISSQALAAACSTACLSMLDQQTLSQQSMPHADTDHCDHGSPDSDNDAPSSKSYSCSMAGCHLAQTVAFASETDTPVIQVSDSHFPQFISTAVTADQPPPIKPPA